MFTTPSPWCCAAALLGFIAYRLNQQYGSGDGWMYETESVITMVLGLWMVNVVFARPSPAEFPVGARNLFRQCFAVYLRCTIR